MIALTAMIRECMLRVRVGARRRMRPRPLDWTLDVKLPTSSRKMMCQNSSDGIVTGYGLDQQGVGVRVPVAGRIFFFSATFTPALGPIQPPLQWLSGLKQPGSEVDHSPTTNTELKKTLIHRSTLPYVFMLQWLIKHKENFNFYFT
jgi:hypothetical protein